MFSFDFEVLERPLDADAYTTPSSWLPSFTVPGAYAAVVGRDAMGGPYVTCEFSSSGARRCLHLDISGHVVVLGESLEEAVTILVALPYWRELLAQSPPSGAIEELRAQAVHLEREVFDDIPALPEARDYLQQLLGFPKLRDPLARLYELNTQTEPVVVLSPHGWRYESPGVRVRTQAGTASES
jgi:hypothetical protein